MQSNFLNDCGGNGGGAADGTCNNDVSLAVGFNFALAAGGEAVITLTASSQPPAGGFFLQQLDPDVRGDNLYLSETVDIKERRPRAWYVAARRHGVDRRRLSPPAQEPRGAPMSGWNGRSASVWTCAVVVLLSVIGVIDRSRADAATIFVTTLSDKISSTGGCSLKEAIHSANFDSNIAIDQVLPGGIDHFITTQCVPGSGADTIVLPAGVTFSMLRVTDDLHNPIGPTATPIVFTTITIEGNGSTLQWSGALSRAFTIGTASININPNENVTNFVSGTGNLTIRNIVHQRVCFERRKRCRRRGGGMGAGGAIYVMKNAQPDR